MKNQIIVDETCQYDNQYVALRKNIGNSKNDVIAFGPNYINTQNKALERGFKNPVMIFVSNGGCFPV